MNDIDVYLSSDAATHIPGCDANCFGAETCTGSAEPVPGRWVPWCMKHRSPLVRESDTCDESVFVISRCIWHPQGAFIPDEGGTT